MAYKLSQKSQPPFDGPKDQTWIPDEAISLGPPARLLAFICLFQKRNRRMPTVDEMSKGIGSSHKTIIGQRACLVKHGFLERYGTVTKPPHVDEKTRWEVWERNNFTCQHCGARRFLAVDHIYPKSKGGSNDLNNLQTLCKKCNTAKSNRVDKGICK